MERTDNYFAAGGRHLLLLLLLQFFSLILFAQVRISGRVTSAKGNGVAGASVLVRGTSVGGSTDVDGAYSLNGNLKTGTYTLEVSAIGYKSQTQPLQMVAGETATANIQLQEDALGLEEIVVTGNPTATKRKQLGNYVTSVNANQLSGTGASNPIGALSGKVAGAQISQNTGNPAGGFSVRLRGANSIISSSEPLYIIDGVIVNNNTNNVTDLTISISGSNDFQPGANRLADINPNDIDRVEVLNGASAAAIYGSRASNGVVQIFTKRGQIGAPKITASTSLMSSSLRRKIAFNSHPEKFGIGPVTRTGTGNDQRLTQILLFNRLYTQKVPVTRYDYQDDVFQNAMGTDNYVSVTGGTDKSRYALSGSYFFNQGIARGTDFRRWNAKLRVEQTFNKWLKGSLGVNYINSFGNERPDGNSFYSSANSIFIIDNVYNLNERDANGNLLAVEPVRVNPLSVVEGIKMTNRVNRTIADVQFTATPVKNLTLNLVSGFDTYSQLGQTLIKRYPYPGVSALFFNDGYAGTGTADVFQINTDLTANYQFNINNNVKSVTAVGATFQYDRNNFISAQGRDLSPFVETIAAANNRFDPGTEIRTERSIEGYFLQQSFSYKDLIYLTGAGRIDRSSVFGASERTQFFPKVSGTFVVSELFGTGGLSRRFDLLKLRAAYGESGNLTGLGAYDRFNNMDPVNYLGRQTFVRRTFLGNENARPERQTELEIGLDMAAYNGRVGLTVNWYNKQVKDLLLNRTLAPTQGGTNIIENIGSLTNKGIEVILNLTPVKTKDFNWNLTAIYNRNRNKVSLPVDLIRFSADANRMSSAINGRPLGVFYGTVYARNPDGSILLSTTPRVISGVTFGTGLPYVDRVGKDANGLPIASSALVQREVGDPNPDWSGSLLNELSYKRFSLKFLFEAVQGFDVVNLNRTTHNNVGAGKLAEREIKGEIPRGYVSLLGGFGDERIREDMVEDGSFVKLRELSLSYVLKPKWKGFQGITVTATGRNLLSFDNYKGWDPEVNSGGQSNRIRGDDFGTIPIPRQIIFGISANF
jgi:TonB-linked SusC/RagA family outer membrane protein